MGSALTAEKVSVHVRDGEMMVSSQPCPHWNPHSPSHESSPLPLGSCQGGWTRNPTIRSSFNRASTLLGKEMRSAWPGQSRGRRTIPWSVFISPGNTGEGKEVLNRISMVELSFLPKSCAGHGGGRMCAGGMVGKMPRNTKAAPGAGAGHYKL